MKLTDIGNTSKKNVPYFGRLSTESKLFLIHYPAAIMMSLRFFSLLKMSSETIKLIDCILLSFYLNHKKSHFLVFTTNIKMS